MSSYTLTRAPNKRNAAAMTTNSNNNNTNNNNNSSANANANAQNPSARAVAAEPNSYNNPNNSPYSGEDSPDEAFDENASLRSQALNADGTPKRPMNAFMIFARRRRPQVSAQNQMMRTGEISKILSREWIAMGTTEKGFYQDQAKKLKETFNLKYPDYVYRRRPNNSRKKRRMDAAPYDLSTSPHQYSADDYGSVSPVDGPPYRLPYGGIDGAYYSHGHTRQYTEPVPAMNPAPAVPAPAPVPVYGADHHPHPQPHHAHPADPHFASQPPPHPQQQWHPSSFGPSRTENPSFRNNYGARNGTGHHGGGAGHAVATVAHGGAGGVAAGTGSLGGAHGPASSYDSQLRLGARRGMIPPPINAIPHHGYHGTNGHGYGHGHGHHAAQQDHHPRHWSDDTGSSVSPPSSAGSGGFPPGFGCGPGNGGNGYGTLNGGSGNPGGNSTASGAPGGFGSLTAPFFPSTSPSTSSISTTSSSSGGPTTGTTSAAPGAYYPHTRGGAAAADTYDAHLHSSHTGAVSHHPQHTSSTRQPYGHTPPHLGATLSLSPAANGALWSSMRTKPEM